MSADTHADEICEVLSAMGETLQAAARMDATLAKKVSELVAAVNSISARMDALESAHERLH